MDKPEWILQLVRDWRAAALATADRTMLAYAEKVTREPWAVARADVDALRAAGFSDAAIHDICPVAAYFNFINRMADGLGVELEAGWAREESDPGGPGAVGRRCRRGAGGPFPLGSDATPGVS